MSKVNLNNQILTVKGKGDNKVLARSKTGAISWSLVPDAPDQKWKFIEVPGYEDTYFISNNYYGDNLTCVTVPGVPNIIVDTRPHNPGSQDQFWKLTPVTELPGVYQIVNIARNTAIMTGIADGYALVAFPFVPGSKDQCWQIYPACDWDIRVTGVNYKKDALKGLVGSPDIFWSASVQNDSKATIRQRITKTISRSSTFEFSFSETLSASITVEFEAGIPLLASANLSATVSLELTASQRWEKNETLTYGIDSDIEIPPNTSAYLLANVDWLDNATIPFTMVLRIKAKDKDGKPLDNGQLEGLLIATGFNGKIIDNKTPKQLMVSIDGELAGSWGINSTLILIEPEPETKTRSEISGGKKTYQTIGRSPIEGLF